MSKNLVFNARDLTWNAPEVSSEVGEFHRSLAEYSPTELVEFESLARELGVDRVFGKAETLRLGLPAFKGLGASWAVRRAIEKFGTDITVVTATDGNHGRAIAKFCRLTNVEAVIFVPLGIHPTAVQAIRDEGAQVIEIADVYDVAVAEAAKYAAEEKRVLIQDTAWPGYEEIPGWIVEGYETLFAELDAQLQAAGVSENFLVVVPAGVGSLLQAALTHYRNPSLANRVKVVSVEPIAADCIFESVKSGSAVSVETGNTIMAGLNCGTPSSLAWPIIESSLDAAVRLSDEAALSAMSDLQALGIDAGPCAAAGLAALRELSANRAFPAEKVVVFLLTESSAANPFA